MLTQVTDATFKLQIYHQHVSACISMYTFQEVASTGNFKGNSSRALSAEIHYSGPKRN